MVRCILVETTRPVKIRPRIETIPVKGHFLSVCQKHNLSTICSFLAPPKKCALPVSPRDTTQKHIDSRGSAKHIDLVGVSSRRVARVPGRSICNRAGACGWKHTDVVALNGGLGGLEPQTNVLVPSPAALARPGGLDLDLGVKEDCKMSSSASVLLRNLLFAAGPRSSLEGNSLCGCLRKARSLWTVSSVAILSGLAWP